MKPKVLFSWSGGKDSAIALADVLASQSFEMVALLTTVTEEYDRISMHGVRHSLLRKQAEALGLPLEVVLISENGTNEDYKSAMVKVLSKYKQAGVSEVVFGDIFLEEVRTYREENLAKMDMKGIFPNWGKDTGELARDFVSAGYRAVLTCVDTQSLDKDFIGREIDLQFLSDLPPEVDPCGENGEYHSFVFDGPIFKEEIAHILGEVVLRRDRFYYCDLVPA
jgi:uncharacterized protein (TIGR00290 family)